MAFIRLWLTWKLPKHRSSCVRVPITRSIVYWSFMECTKHRRSYNTTRKKYNILESTLGPYLWKPRMEFPEFFWFCKEIPSSKADSESTARAINILSAKQQDIELHHGLEVKLLLNHLKHTLLSISTAIAHLRM